MEVGGADLSKDLKKADVPPLEEYARSLLENPAVRGLSQVYSVGQVVTAVFAQWLENREKQRSEAFWSSFELEAAKRNIELTPEIIASDDFLYCSYLTEKAFINTRRIQTGVEQVQDTTRR